MSGGTLTAVLAAFVIYLLLMIIIGALYMKKTNNSEDYFLGGPRTKRLDRRTFGSGIRYERLVTYGTARYDIRTWHWSVLDCHRSVARYDL